MQWMLFLLVALLVAATVFIYVRGVRPGRKWGTPALVLAVLMAVGLALCSSLLSGQRGRAPSSYRVDYGADRERARQLALAVQDAMPTDATICVLMPGVWEKERRLSEWEKGIRMVFPRATLVSSTEPPEDEMMMGVENMGERDEVTGAAFVLCPLGARRIALEQIAEAGGPPVGLCFPTEHGRPQKSGEPETAREYCAAGLVVVAVLEDGEGGFEVIRPDAP